VTTRVVTVVVCLAGLAVAGALFVREALLAHEQRLTWTPPGWWTRLLHDGWARTGLLGFAALAAALGLLALAVRLVAPARGDETTLELGTAEESVAVAPQALHSLVAGTLARFAGVTATRARVVRSDEDDRLTVRARVAVPPEDLARLHAGALGALRRELARATGLDMARLTLEIERFTRGSEG
jgi:hypothetical protein